MSSDGTRRFTAAIVGLVLVVAGCVDSPDPAGEPEESAPPPTNASGGYAYEDAQVRGVVTHADGTPTAGVDISVVAGATSSERTNAFLTTMFTGGIVCIVNMDACSADDDVVATMATGADGSYSATLPDAYLPGYETDTDWFVTASVPAADGQLLGSTSSVEFETNAPVQAAPPLMLWETVPTVVDGPLLTVDVGDPPAVPDASRSSTEVQFVDDSGAEIWTMGGTTVDARLLEDAGVRLLGFHQADVRVDHAEGRTIYHLRLVTATVPYTGSPVPVSRGAACSIGGDSAGSCPVTDGVLVPPDPATGETPEPSPRDVTIDLAERQPIGLVVVRGSGGCTVEASNDGREWTALATERLGGANGIVAVPDGPLPARQVRVTECALADEVSVWPPLDQAAISDPTDEVLGVVVQDGEDGLDVGRLALGLVAALLIGVVGTMAIVRFRGQRSVRAG